MVGPVARLLPLGNHVKRFSKDRLSQLGNELDQIEASCPGFDPASTRVSWRWPGLAGELDAPSSNPHGALGTAACALEAGSTQLCRMPLSNSHCPTSLDAFCRQSATSAQPRMEPL